VRAACRIVSARCAHFKFLDLSPFPAHLLFFKISPFVAASRCTIIKRGYCMTLVRSVFCSISVLFFLVRTAECSHPSELLADVVSSSPIIFVGKISDARKTDKFMMHKADTHYYYVYTVSIDTMLKGDASIKKFEIMDFPGTPECMDTTRNIKFLFFLSKSPFVAEGVTDWMAERQYKITKGKITPAEMIDETKTQGLAEFSKKIVKIVKDQSAGSARKKMP
jgi:hypothetical protein